MRRPIQSPRTHQPLDAKVSVELDDLQIASPCSADWDAMAGNAKRRFCGECSLHVHDLSAMTSDEALEFLAEQSGRTCVRMRRRADGRVLTQDCPVGFARVRAGARALRRRLAVCSAFLLGALWSCTPRSNTDQGAVGAGSGSGSESGSGAGAGAVTGQTTETPEMGEPLMGGIGMPEQEPLMGKVVPPEAVEPVEEPRKQLRPEQSSPEKGQPQASGATPPKRDSDS